MSVATHATSAFRSLFKWNGFAVACVAFVLLVSDVALAHSGHRHDSGSQAQVTGLAEASSAPLGTISAKPDQPNDSVALPRHVIGLGVARTVEAEVVFKTHVSGLTHYARCICGGACGSCTSMSCCSAILASSVDQPLRGAQGRAHGLPVGDSMTDVEIAPLPRPPNPALLT